MENQVKHGGCKVCGSKDQKVLKSVKIPGEAIGIAVCDTCRSKIQNGR